MAAVAGDVAPQRGDLEMPTIRDRAHGAVGEAGRDRRQAGALEQPNHLLRALGRGEVDLGSDRPAQQTIAHAAADEPRLTAVRPQGRENPAAGRRAQPSLRRERACGACSHPPGARNDKRVLLIAVIVRPQAVVGIGMGSFRIASRPSGRRK